MGALLHNGDDDAPELGVTANAILVAGVVAGLLDQHADTTRGLNVLTYRTVAVDAASASIEVINARSGNRFRIMVVQATGSEFAPEAAA